MTDKNKHNGHFYTNTDEIQNETARLLTIANEGHVECKTLQEENMRLRAVVDSLREAIEPFAKCCEYIEEDEDDEEWVKFRLIIKDYRQALQAYTRTVDDD